jgi:hypothetical protein
VGGVLGDVYGIRRPFEVAFFLYITSSIYGALFMPGKPLADDKQAAQKNRGVGGFFAPLKVIVPQKYVLEGGRAVTNYGLIFLALGIFVGVVSYDHPAQLKSCCTN